MSTDITTKSVIVTTKNQNDQPIVTQKMMTKDIHHYSKRFSSLSWGCSKCNLPNEFFFKNTIYEHYCEGNVKDEDHDYVDKSEIIELKVYLTKLRKFHERDKSGRQHISHSEITHLVVFTKIWASDGGIFLFLPFRRNGLCHVSEAPSFQSTTFCAN